MASYILNWTNSTLKTAITVPDLYVNTISSDLKLYGRGARSYGEGTQENMLRLLENFASDVPPSKPTEGQLWYNTAVGVYTKGLKLFNGTDWINPGSEDLSAIISDLDSKVERSGDVMSGYLTLYDDPTDAYHAATKKYTDDRDLLRLSLSGGTLTNFLTLHADPLLSLHAATKAYVDFSVFNAFQNLVGLPTTSTGTFKRIEMVATANQQLFTGLPTYVQGNNSIWGVYVNGVKQGFSAYTETSTTSVTFTTPLNVGDVVVFDMFVFVVSPQIGVSSVTRQETIATVGQTVVTVPSYVVGSNSILVWVNGVKQIKGVGYNETSSSVITFTAGLDVGAVVEVRIITLTGGGTGILYQSTAASTPGQTVINVSPPYYSPPGSDPNKQQAVVFINGVMQNMSSYVELGGTSIILSGGLDVGDRVEVYVYDITP